MNIWICFFITSGLVVSVQCHGRLLEPPSRSSLFRFSSSDPMLIPYRDIIQTNYNDHELYCGGRQVQINNNGRCGVCGDSYSDEVKENEAGGKYALGIITRNYEQGSIIDATVEITAPHLGYFEFRLCPWNNVEVPITHQCLNQHLLRFNDGNTKWYLPRDSAAAVGEHHLRLQLPRDVTCTQCVLQWRYRTGNSWGVEDGRQGLGLGQQEEFYGCSDVSISGNTNSSATAATSTQTLGSSSTPITKESFQTTTESYEDVNANEREIDCSRVELGQPIFRDCHSFFTCAFPQHAPFVFACPPGTRCHPDTGRCLHPWDVPMCP